MKISFISTVFNEERSINLFIESILTQTKLPDEIIIVDGGSTDATASVISKIKSQISNKGIRFKFVTKHGNRSVGRNEAIKRSTGNIIVCSDAGCILDKDWVKNIIKPIEDKNIDVVAGYYRGRPRTIFEKCLIPYVLVMEDKVNPKSFLPATRSMAFTKSIWKKAGMFPEKFSNNEDYVFANKLKKIKAKMVFEKNAIAYWTPRKSLKEAFVMFFRFAKGDSESRIFRPKVFLIFLRYAIGVGLFLLFVFFKFPIILNTLYIILASYVLWSITKNYKYVKDVRALVLLPLIQITSDEAIILGTISGLLSSKLKILIEGLIYLAIIYFIILLTFRQLRSLFSPPKIIEGEIIGYAQYFGYPLYFETIIFFIFILSPVIVFFILSKIRKSD